MIPRIIGWCCAALLLWGTTAWAGQIVAVNYAPLMIEEGPLPGLSIEVIKEAERRIGVDNPVVFLPFQRAIKTVQARADTLHPALYRNPQREDQYTWIVKYHRVNDVFLTVGTPVDTLEQARTLPRIGVEAKTAMDVFLTARDFSDLERVDRPDVNAAKLAAGRIDAWALTDILAQWTWRRVGIEQPLTVGRPIYSSDVYIVGGKEFPPALAEQYRAAVTEMLADGTVEAILRKYR